MCCRAGECLEILPFAACRAPDADQRAASCNPAEERLLGSISMVVELHCPPIRGHPMAPRGPFIRSMDL